MKSTARFATGLSLLLLPITNSLCEQLSELPSVEKIKSSIPPSSGRGNTWIEHVSDKRHFIFSLQDRTCVSNPVFTLQVWAFDPTWKIWRIKLRMELCGDVRLRLIDDGKRLVAELPADMGQKPHEVLNVELRSFE